MAGGILHVANVGGGLVRYMLLCDIMLAWI